MGASQIRRSGTRSGNPRSMPLFHTSDPYVMIYIYIYIYIEHVQSVFTFVRTYMSAHPYMSAYMQEYVYYAQTL